MIRDNRLKLADNLAVTAGRNIVGIKQSDLFPVLSLGEFGRGEQLFCCVTVRETFNVPAGDPIFIKMSLKEELFTYTGLIDGEVAGGPLGEPGARHCHNKQPILASSGYIELAPDPLGSNLAANNNFVAGKKFTFAINPYSASLNSSTLGPGSALSVINRFQGGTYAYFLFEEFSSGIFDTAFTPVNVLSAGKIDVEITNIVDSGAGTNFSDVHCYPTRTTVR